MRTKPLTLEEAYAHFKRMGYFRTLIAIAVSQAVRSMARG